MLPRQMKPRLASRSGFEREVNREHFMIPLLVGLPLFIVAVVVCVVLSIRREAAFTKRFPPMSDEEFVARCTPGTDPDIALRVRKIVAEALNVDYGQIYPSSRFVEDLGA